MSFQQIMQQSLSQPEQGATTTPEPLWKRITSKINYDNFQSTLQSSNSPQGSATEISLQFNKNASPIQPNINQFLLKLHHRISDSIIGSESQVMEKISLDWGEESRIRPALSNITKSFSINESNSLTQTPRTQRVICTQMLLLREITNIDDFLNFIVQLNPKIHRQVSNLVDQNTKLNQECCNLKYKQKKTDVKIKLQNNQIQMLEKKNIKLLQDFEKLKKQVDMQIQLQEDKLKYKYEKKIQQIRQQFQKRQNTVQSTTTCSNSNYFAPMEQLAENKQFTQKTNPNYCQTRQQTKQKRKGELTRTSKRNVNFADSNIKEGQNIRSQMSKKPGKSQMEQIISQIIRSNKKQNRSLKLLGSTPQYN